MGLCWYGTQKAGLEKAIGLIQELRNEFWHDLKIVGKDSYMNPVIEKACRVADFMEFAELITHDALERDESAVLISVKNTRPKKAKLSVMTKSLRMLPPGNTKV